MKLRGNFKIPNVTRLEVIEEEANSVVLLPLVHNAGLELSFQDEGKTLKIYIIKKLEK